MIKEGEGNKQRAKEWKGKGGLEGLGSSPNQKETGKRARTVSGQRRTKRF